MKGVTGIGGTFFISENPEKLKAWYTAHLGINSAFYWKDAEQNSLCYTVWNVFPKSSGIFKKTNKEYVFNYRVDNLDLLLKELKKHDISLIDEIDVDENGKFGYILDPEGNKIILWEPGDKDIDIPNSSHDRVTGLGGVFFKSSDPKKLNEWYGKHLGFIVTEWGCSFNWIDPQNPDAKTPAMTAWSTFKDDTNYFDPSKKQFMLNYRVKNLVDLLKTLEAEGVEVVGKMEEFSYGKFGWILDPEKNKIELWEPIDDGF